MLADIAPECFTHWKVFSRRNDAVLCEVTTRNPGQKLGLFWEFKSPKSEFAYLPAIWPTNKEGKISECLGHWGMERAFMLDYGRPRKDFSNPSYFPDPDPQFKYNFSENEAKAYVELIKLSTRNLKDYDDTIYAAEYEPPIWRRLHFFSVLILGLALLYWIFRRWF